jgi:D-glycero-D-manno-heptose 1,7-bisphosphate phosphatase
MRPAVFLDRDGTMIHDVGYLGRLADVRWYPWTVEAVRLLNRAGLVVCVTTNQGGVGLGFFTEAFVQDLHTRMDAVLAEGGARVDGWFYCPHHPQARLPEFQVACACRKPGAGMVQDAARRHAIDLSRSFVIGDKLADVEMATAAGALGILVRTGYGEDVVQAHGGKVPGAVHVTADLMEATAWVLRQIGRPPDER